MGALPQAGGQRLETTVDGYFHVGFSKTGLFGRFGNAQPFDLRFADGARLFGRQGGQQCLDIHAGGQRLLEALDHQDGFDILDGDRKLAAAHMIDQPVARNGIEPCGKGPVAVIGGALAMDRDQRFLHQILDIAVRVAHPAAVEGRQQRDQSAQQRLMRDSIAAEPRDHPCLQLCFACLHAASRRGLRGWVEHGYSHFARWMKIFLLMPGVTGTIRPA
jgi:hypothetical protein